MKNIKNQIVGILLCLTLMAVLVGCGSKDVVKEESPENAIKTVELNFPGGAAEANTFSSEDYEEVRDCIEHIYTEIADFDERGYEKDGDIASAVESVEKLAKGWQGDGIVSEVVNHGHYVYIKFESGINYFFSPSPSNTSGPGKDDEVDIYSLQIAKTEFITERGEPTATVDNAATDDSATKIANKYENFNWKYNLDDKDVTLQTVLGFGSNEVILWHGHGAYFDETGPVLALKETIYDVEYSNLDYTYLVDDGAYLVTPEFINSYVGDLTNTFIYLNSCAGLRDNRLVDAFSNKNVEAVVAHTDVVTTIYACNIMAATLDSMVNGKSLEEGMADAKVAFGERDANVYYEYGAVDYAVPTIYKGGDYKFEEDIEPDYLDSGQYQSDYEYVAKLSKDNSMLTVTSSFWHYDDSWNMVTDYERREYNIPIYENCMVETLEAEAIIEPLSDAARFVTDWFNSGNQLGFSIEVVNGEIVRFVLSS